MKSLIAVHDQRPEADERLADFDLTQDILWEAILFGYEYAVDMTENDPPTSKGITVWGKTTRRFRDLVKPRGWYPVNEESYATTVHPKGNLALTVAAGDWRTGLRDESPETRAKKGPATRSAIRQNQLRFSQIDPKWEVIIRGRETWILLYHFGSESQEFRAELSLPIEMGFNGHVSAWQERILLAPPGRTPAVRPAGASLDEPRPELDDIHVPVFPKV